MTATTGRFEHLRAALLDRSLCPACGAPLRGPRCLWCGVPLDGPAARTVLQLSVAAADALARREEGLRELYAERDARFAAATSAHGGRVGTTTHVVGAADGIRPAPSPAGTVPVDPLAVHVAAGSRRGPEPTATGPRWRVQTVLQALGAGLLSAAGIVFLLFSWDVLNLEVRATVVALGTVVVFALAGLLARRGLRQGAEAVGAVAAVLLLLDAWALRRTGVVGLGRPEVYASVSALVCSAVLAVWGRSARLRVGTVGAAVLWLAAPLPLAALDPSPGTLGWLLLVTVALSWLRHARPLAQPSAEDASARLGTAVLTLGAAAAWSMATLVGVGWAAASSARAGGPGAALAFLGAAAGTAAVQGLLARARPAPADRELAASWSHGAVAVAVLAALATAGFGHLPHGTGWALVGAGGAMVLLALLDAATPAPSPEAATPAPPRGVVGPAVTGSVLPTMMPAGCLLAATGIATLLPGGRLAATLVLLSVAAVGMLADRRLTTRDAPGPWITAARLTLVGATVLAVVVAHSSSGTLAAALATCAAVSVHGRTWGPGQAWAASSTAAAAPWGLAAIGALVHALGATAGDTVAVTAATGAAALSLVVVAPDRPRPERQVALTAAAFAAGSGWLLAASVPQWWGRSTLLAVAASCLLVVLVLATGSERVGALPVSAATGLAAPAVALAAVSLAALLDPAPPAGGVVLVAAGAGGAAALLTSPVRERWGAAAARAGTVGGWTTLAGALVGALSGSAHLTATVLLVAAVVALVTGVRDRRPGLRWGALGLATLASWTLLGGSRTGNPEVFTAPTALVVAIVGAVRVHRTRSDGAVLLGGGLVLTLLPTALLRGSLALPGGVHADRRLLSTVAAVLLTLLAARRAARVRDDVVPILAGLGAVLAVLGPMRAGLDAARPGTASPVPELLGLLAAALLLQSARTLRRVPATTLARATEIAEPWVVVAAAVLPSVLAAAPGTPGLLRTVGAAAAGVLVTLVAATRAPRPDEPSEGHLLGVGLLLATAAAVMALRALPDAPTDVVPAVLGVLVMATVLLRPPRRAAPADTVRAVAGPALLVPVLLARTGTWRPIAWLLLGIGLVLAAWLVRHREGSTSAVRLAAGTGAGIALAGPWWHAVAPLLTPTGSAPGAPELWTVPVGLILGATLALAVPRPGGLPAWPTLVAPALGVVVVPSLLVADSAPLGLLRLTGTLTLGTALAVVAQERRFDGRPAPESRDAARAVAAGVAIATAATVTASIRGPWPPDVPVVALGLLLVALGVRRAVAEAGVGSWHALGAGLLCATLVPALVSGADPAPWRPLVVVVLAVTATVCGAALRWQAPFAVGAVSLVVVTVLQLGPWAGQVLARTQGWVLLAVCGTILLALGLRYERRLAQAREAVRFVATMR